MVTPMHSGLPKNAPKNAREYAQLNAPEDMPEAAVAIDFEAAAKLAVYLVENGSDALVLSGTTGEAPTTHLQEKAQLIKTVRAELLHTFPEQKVPIIAGTGSNDTAHAVRNTEVAYESGADAALVVTPYYSRPSQDGIFEHFAAVAKATPLPIILYDVPGRSGVSIEVETYARLAAIPNIVAVKDATGNVYKALKARRAMDEVRRMHGLPVTTLYSGDDSLLLPFLAIGASGIISVASHIIGETLSEIIWLQQSDDSECALDMFEEVMYAVDICNDLGQQAACTKAALQALGVIPNRQMRLPNLQLDEKAYAKLASRILASADYALQEKIHKNYNQNEVI